ncbi:MAG: lytic transglycosylase domain-containing protein, partial [Pseudomonadota bacterium]
MRLAVFLMTALIATPAVADRMDRFERALGVLDNRAATQYSFSSRLQPDTGRSEQIPAYAGRHD